METRAKAQHKTLREPGGAACNRYKVATTGTAPTADKGAPTADKAALTADKAATTANKAAPK
jgi:hypothetical protein